VEERTIVEFFKFHDGAGELLTRGDPLSLRKAKGMLKQMLDVLANYAGELGEDLILDEISELKTRLEMAESPLEMEKIRYAGHRILEELLFWDIESAPNVKGGFVKVFNVDGKHDTELEEILKEVITEAKSALARAIEILPEGDEVYEEVRNMLEEDLEGGLYAYVIGDVGFIKPGTASGHAVRIKRSGNYYEVYYADHSKIRAQLIASIWEKLGARIEWKTMSDFVAYIPRDKLPAVLRTIAATVTFDLLGDYAARALGESEEQLLLDAAEGKWWWPRYAEVLKKAVERAREIGFKTGLYAELKYGKGGQAIRIYHENRVFEFPVSLRGVERLREFARQLENVVI